eukprot:CAMPEP_0203818566 /NCGR_PEP_ID=MMETSP0115-20131106/32019_1 /ASSEMBLY_ACC=CAM_ASM_000227 /TAXON_ID=33651 /ORGANISM="Bicosoecid sp, Strain ms1" /LENGTH=135 /DNA_ID=CAMNT_0050727531 /DNA_START=173 /DNA_END=577 /DNA_ORIENTATION=-
MVRRRRASAGVAREVGEAASAAQAETTAAEVDTAHVTKPLPEDVPTRTATFQQIAAHPKLSYAADNAFIVGRYRTWYSLRSCLVSLFEIHNETVNVWSHLIGVILFSFLLWQLSMADSRGHADAATSVASTPGGG